MEQFNQYLQTKELSSATIDRYTRQVTRFTAWHTGESINVQKKDIINYLAYLKNTNKLQSISRNNALIALRHYFDHLTTTNQIATNPTNLIKLRGTQKRKLHHTYNLEELAELADTYYQLEVKRTQENLQTGKGQYLKQRAFNAKLRNYAILQFFIHQGLQSREILELKTDDLQLNKASVLIRKGSVRGNARTLPLHATQIGALMQYLNEVRPRLETPNTDNTLFLPIPKNDPKAKKQAELCFKGLNRQLKKLDRNYSSLVQLRASVITYWINTHGLRKAQYLAGHKSIASTETYLPNLIEDLAEDITKFNPF
jgi:site-specific recombinase XerD